MSDNDKANDEKVKVRHITLDLSIPTPGPGEFVVDGDRRSVRLLRAVTVEPSNAFTVTFESLSGDEDLPDWCPPRDQWGPM